jgi:hypothetical protein
VQVTASIEFGKFDENGLGQTKELLQVFAQKLSLLDLSMLL